MRRLLVTVLTVLCGYLASNGQILLSESFDNTTFPPTGWTRSNVATNTFNSQVDWLRATSGTGSPAPNTHTGSGMAFYNSYWVSSGYGDLLTPALNFTTAGSKVLSFWAYRYNGFANDSLAVYVNTTASTTGATQLASIAVNYASTNGWVQYSYTLPASYNTATNYIIFRCKSAYGYDTYLDDVQVVNLVPCTGAPNGGTAFASPNPICAGRTLVLNDTNATIGGSITYQWQSSPAGAGTWTDIAGATTTQYTLTAGVSAATDFRLKVVCGNSSTISYSSTATVTLNPGSACYCTPVYGSGCAFGDDINTFTLTGTNSTSFNQLNTGCTTGGYANYTSLTPVQLLSGAAVQTYSGTINSNYSSQAFRIWIDFNDDGNFSNAETVATLASGTVPVNPATSTFSITIPANSNAGVHRMRVRGVYVGTASTMDPCISYSYGETHDYLIQILGPPPAPTVTNNGPVCSNTPVTVTATTNAGSPTFTLTGTGIATSLTNSTGVFTFTNPTAGTTGTYNVTVTSFGYTSPAGSTTVNFYPLPAITLDSVNSPTSCTGANGSIRFIGAANTTYTLRYRRNTVAQPTATITTNASGAYTITNLNVGTYDSIRVTNANGCVSNSLGPVSLSLPSAPNAPTATYNQPLCLGATLQLTVTNVQPNTTYSWNGPNNYVATGSAPQRLNISYADTGTYQVTATQNGCTSAAGLLPVQVTQPSPLPAVTPVSICQNTAAASLASAVTAQGTLTWYGTNATGGTGSSTPSVPNTSTAGTTNYYVTQTLAVGCSSNRAAIPVTVKPAPGAPSSPVTTFTYCQFDIAAPLTATAASGNTLVYYTVPSGGSGQASLTPSTNIADTFRYYVAQSQNGCEGPRLVITVIVKPKPTPPVVQSPLNLCQNDVAAPLTAQGTNLLWYVGPTGGPGVPNAPIPYTGFEDSARYYVTQTVNGCQSDRALIQVYINYRPNATFVASKPYVCQKDTISFIYFGNARPDAEYNWFVTQPNGVPVSGQGTQGPFVVRFDSAGTYSVRLAVNNKGCLSPQVFLPVEVRPLPKLKLIAKSDICIGETVDVKLDSATDGISSFTWTFDGADTSYATLSGGPYGLRWNTPGDKYITVAGTTRGCTTNPALVDTITVHDYPAAEIIDKPSGSVFDVCAGDSIRLQARDLGPGYFYGWTPTKAFQNREVSGGSIAWATPPVGLLGNYALVLTVSDSFGCKGVDSLVVATKPCCDVYFPNAFTPNGDGKNDRFAMVSNGNPVISSFRVVNRYGAVVWETGDARQGWDGTVSGEPAPSGTYGWYAKYRCTNGQEYEQKGELTLLR